MLLHHVQILSPPGGEQAARAFYGAILGLREIPRPDSLPAEGVWFEVNGGGQVHVGIVRADDRPGRSRAHFALLTKDLDALRRRLAEAGCEVIIPPPVPGWDRIHIRDPFGNMIELLRITSDLTENITDV